MNDKIWKLINSSFFIWLMTSVVGGVGIWSFENYLNNRKEITNLAERAERIDIELEGRIAQYASWVDGIVEKSDSRADTIFLSCVTNKYLHESIKTLGNKPSMAVLESGNTIDNECPKMFSLVPMFESLDEISLIGLYAERVAIEKKLYPGPMKIDEDGSQFIDRDSDAAKAIGTWSSAINPILRPDAITGLEIGEKGEINYKEFHERIERYFYSSPKQQAIFHYGDCFRC